MDKLVRKIEIPLAKQRILKAGLYIVPEDRLEELSEAAADAYQDYPLHNWFTKGIYDPVASKLIMQTTLAAMKDDAVIYADSEELNGLVYLETNKESNVPLYERFKFELRETNMIPGSSIQHYSMVRDPK